MKHYHPKYLKQATSLRKELLSILDVHDNEQLHEFAEVAFVEGVSIVRPNGKEGWAEGKSSENRVYYYGALASLNHFLGGGVPSKWTLEAFEAAYNEWRRSHGPVMQKSDNGSVPLSSPTFVEVIRGLKEQHPGMDARSYISLAKEFFSDT